MIARNVIFANNTGYDIHATIAKVCLEFEDTPWCEQVVNELIELQYSYHVADFMTDLDDGILTFTDIWFETFGVEHGWFSDNRSIETFSVHTESDSTLTTVNTAEERELCAARVLFSLDTRPMIPNDIDFLHEEMTDDDFSDL